MTTISVVSICNQALIALGAKTIESLTENSKNGRLCNAIYEQTRNNVLTDHIWNFAQKRAELEDLDEEPEWTDDLMTVTYQKPTDCLKINFINIESAIFKIEGDKVLSNESGLKIKYTEEVIDPMKFFPKFVEALVARLAAELAYPITSSRTMMDSLFTIYYEKKLPQAISADSQQGTPQGVAQDDILISRISGSGSLVGRAGFETWYPCG